MSDSMIHINGNIVPLASLTAQEKADAFVKMNKRIEQSIKDYLHRHPEQFELVVDALERSHEKQVAEQ